MPYIKPENRDHINLKLEKLIQHFSSRRTFVPEIEIKGEITYTFYKICCEILKMDKVSYNRLSMLTSCLEDAKLEFYRRKIAPYEDLKIQENGDV